MDCNQQPYQLPLWIDRWGVKGERGHINRTTPGRSDNYYTVAQAREMNLRSDLKWKIKTARLRQKFSLQSTVNANTSRRTNFWFCPLQQLSLHYMPTFKFYFIFNFKNIHIFFASFWRPPLVVVQRQGSRLGSWADHILWFLSSASVAAEIGIWSNNPGLFPTFLRFPIKLFVV